MTARHKTFFNRLLTGPRDCFRDDERERVTRSQRDSRCPASTGILFTRIVRSYMARRICHSNHPQWHSLHGSLSFYYEYFYFTYQAA